MNVLITKSGTAMFVDPLLARTANIGIKIQFNANVHQVKFGMATLVLDRSFAQTEGHGTQYFINASVIMVSFGTVIVV